MSSPDRPTGGWSDFPPSRRISVFFLIAALLFLVLPSFGTAQSPRRPTSPLQAATHALIEGRYDEVDAATDKLDARDPNVVALKGRAAIARGRYDAAEALLRPVAQRAPSSEAALELGLLQHMLGRADATSILEKVAGLADTSSDASEVARAARALRALGRFQEANAAYREASSGAPGEASIQSGWGELFFEKYNNAEALRSFQMALQADPRWAPALLGSARALSDDNPPQAVTLAKRALEINPSFVEANVFLAGEAADAGHLDEARALLGKALAVNPSSLDARAQLAAVAFVEDKPQEFEAEAAKTLAIAPNYGDVYRAAGELAAHNYRFDEAVALTRRALALDARNPRTLAALGIQLLRTGDEPAARAALEESLKLDPFDDRLRPNLLTMMDGLDKFVTVARWRSGTADAQGRGVRAPGIRGVDLAPGVEHHGGALRLHAEGPDPDRDLPEARRLRRPHRRPPRHDRRARRLLRPRGDDGFAAGQAAGRVPVGSDAVARAGTRDHAPDVEPARAALAHGKGFRSTRKNGRARSGVARWTSRSPGCSIAAKR